MTTPTTYYLAIHTDRDYPFVFFTDKIKRDNYIELNECYYPYIEEDVTSIITDKSGIDLKVICGPDGFWAVKIVGDKIDCDGDEEVNIQYYYSCLITTHNN